MEAFFAERRFWVALGALLASFRFLLGRFGRLQAPSCLARGLRSPPGVILGGIFGDFWEIFDGFPHGFLHAFFDGFSACLFKKTITNYVVFSLRAKMGDKRFLQYPPGENQYFSRCALAPAQRGRRRKTTKNNINIHRTYIERCLFFLTFFVPAGLAAKMFPK